MTLSNKKHSLETLIKTIKITISIINITRTFKIITKHSPAEKRKAQIDPKIHAAILQHRDASTLNLINSYRPSSPAEIA